MINASKKRYKYILQELLCKEHVEVEELSQQLHVNPSTIRRDLEQMDHMNLLRRVHGGAVSIEMRPATTYTYTMSFQKNMEKQVEEKGHIALAAARLIQPGDSIALSPGTTMTHLAWHIRQFSIRNLSIITNAVNIATELTGLPESNLTLTGGIFLSDFFALVGPLAEQSLRQMYVTKAFIGITGLDIEYGLTGPNQLEALTHRIILQQAQHTFILADHTKLGQIALHTVLPISAMHTLITDRNASPEFLASLRRSGIEVLIA